MKNIPSWWHRPRRVTVVVDNPSWIVPFAERLVREIREDGDDSVFARDYLEVSPGEVSFYLGCLRVTPPDVLARNRRNLVVHESDLPKGRGFSPLAWQILEGRNSIPICLLEAADIVDSGAVIYRDRIDYEGHELLDELRQKQGDVTLALCHRFLREIAPPAGERQTGAPTFYARRRRTDSRLDPNRTIAEQFPLLRVVDNHRYPAYFDTHGHRYKVIISKMKD